MDEELILRFKRMSRKVILDERAVLSFQTMTDLTSARGLIGIERGTGIVLQADGALDDGVAIRYTLDGSIPTATRGMILLPVFDKLEFVGDLSKIRVIEVSGGAAINYHVFE